MKLRKQAPAKALIVAMTAGLLFAFYGVVRAEPRIKAAPPPELPPPDYQRFFVPAVAPGAAAVPAVPLDLPAPQRRTRAS